ncbi:MAG: thiaminase II [Chloroflexi bacterium]|nr:thiaminase II [Chloroflexota bacterium]
MSPEPFHTALDGATQETWDAIYALPFLAALAEGRLEQERFAYFIAQDVHYLDGFAGVLERAATLADDPVMHAFLTGEAANVKTVELALHGEFAPRLGLDVEAVRAQEPGPVTVAYLDHMRAIAGHGTLGEVIAGVLPCYWVYRRIGLRLAAAPPPHELYATWVAAYASPEFGRAVDRQIALIDTLAEGADEAERDRMRRWFHRSLRYEWMFWDQADRLLEWPVA